MQLLKLADSIDSAQDRNNPFWSAEQNNRYKSEKEQDPSSLYRASVFGFETSVDPEKLETSRKQLYEQLNSTLPDYIKKLEHGVSDKDMRFGILETIKDHYQYGLSDTSRPANDTTLWDHSYAVASLFKVFVAHYFLYQEKLKFPDTKFDILGIGWNSFDYTSKSVRVGDVCGRYRELKQIRQTLRELVEVEFALGNHVYQDDDGIYFLIPVLFDSVKGKKYRAIRNTLQKKIYDLVTKESAGELQPNISTIPGDLFSTWPDDQSSFITHIVNVIDAVRKQSRVPVTFDPDSPLFSPIDSHAGGICPVCRIRRMSRNRDACEPCLERRRGRHNKTYRLHSELADENGRLALIVASTDLTHWLDGSFIRTLFVKHARGAEAELKDFGNTHQACVYEWEAKGTEKKPSYQKIIEREFGTRDQSFGFHYQTLLDHLRTSMCDNSENELLPIIGALYFYRNVNSWYDDEPIKKVKESREYTNKVISSVRSEIARLSASSDENWFDPSIISNDDKLLLNELFAKTPTPSTVLDVWHETENFFAEFIQKNKSIACDKDKKRQHKSIKLLPQDKTILAANIGKTATAELLYTQESMAKPPDPIPVEVIFRAGSIDITDPQIHKQVDWQSIQPLRLRFNDSELRDRYPDGIGLDDILTEDYIPFQTISKSPHLMQCLVPAKHATYYAKQLSDAYYSRFGKVVGRLPLAVGILTFRMQMPMSVVMDGARRLVENFHNSWQTLQKVTARRKGNNIQFEDADLKIENSFSMDLALGDSRTDFYHPYLLLDKEHVDETLKSKPGYFETVLGPVIHMGDLDENSDQKILWMPNYFDYEHLDSSARRFDLSIEKGPKRLHHILRNHGTCPMLLESFIQQNQHIAKILKDKPAASMSKLQEIKAALLNRMHRWVSGADAFDSDAILDNWISDLLMVELGIKSDTVDFEYLKRAILSGHYFDYQFFRFFLHKENKAGSIFE